MSTYSVAGQPDWTNYRLTVLVKGNIGIDKILLFRFTSFGKTYGIKLTSSWPDYYGDKIILLKNDLINWVRAPYFINHLNIWYKISIVANENNIKVFTDDSPVPAIDFTDTDNPNLYGKIGLLVWPGFYSGYGSITSSTFDDVLVTTLDSSLTPTPSPTPTPSTQSPTPTNTPTPIEIPTPTPLPPIIVIPGLGSSWNHKAMATGRDVDQSEWHAIPGLTLYNNLLNTLKNAGYNLDGSNRNLFIFYYNWTKPINNIAEDLRGYIDNIVKPPDDSMINIIGHSMGGMAGRTYLQDNPNHKVDKLITLASPHQGSPKAYYVWEGGQIKKALEPWQRIGAGLVLNLRAPLSPTYAEAIHSSIPSIENLLPSFNYLKKNSVPITLSSMFYKNDWLINLNNYLPNHLISYLNSLIGVIVNSTEDWINVEDPDWVDKTLKLWPDGKPTGNEIKTDGDTYVLKKSANLTGVNNITLNNKDHGAIVTDSDSIQTVMNVLNLTPSSIPNIPDFTYEPSLVFYLASPAFISSLTDSYGNPVGFIDGRMAVIPSPQSERYILGITGTDLGDYDLHIGQILNSGDVWKISSGQIHFGETKTYIFNFDPDSPGKFLFDPSGSILQNSLNSQIDQLKQYLIDENINRGTRLFLTAKLNIAYRFLNSGKIEETIEILYNLRKLMSTQPLDRKISPSQSFYLRNTIQLIIEDLEELFLLKTVDLEPYNEKFLKNELKLTTRVFDKAEEALEELTLKNNSQPFMGTVYLLAKEKLGKGRATLSYESHINLLGARHLSEELLTLMK